MSAIIGVCGSNFCSLIADTRRTTNYDGVYVPTDDSTQKIFRMNDNLIFGATGYYNFGEAILAPFDGLDTSKMNKDTALQSILDYLEQKKFIIPMMRNYIIGYKDASGTFGLCDIHMNFETYKPEVTEKRIHHGNDFAISCLLPPKVSLKQTYYLDLVGQAVKLSKTNDELYQYVAAIIRDIADIDDSVGKTVRVVSILK